MATYEPGSVEARWAGLWRGQPPAQAAGRRWSAVIPPIGVTGALSVVEIASAVAQDVLVRWHRMRGDAAVASLCTVDDGLTVQMAVEKELRQQDVFRHDLGRERFAQRVEGWLDERRRVRWNELRRLGVCIEQVRSTMDELSSAAVREVFVRGCESGAIAPDSRVVAWCPRCLTTLDGPELEAAVAPEGRLYRIRYRLVDGTGSIVVATTRPELLVGAVAVAVPPDDVRYRHLVGKRVELPLLDRIVPIVEDPLAVEQPINVLPAHEADGFTIARRHRLTPLMVMDPDAALNEEAGPYAGMDRYDARRQMVTDLDDDGLLVEETPCQVPLERCRRCATVVEPRLSRQWFVRLEPPLSDWCISRQGWWGHRIPAWSCGGCGLEEVHRVDPRLCQRCGGSALSQDADVLDPLFAAVLWPLWQAPHDVMLATVGQTSIQMPRIVTAARILDQQKPVRRLVVLPALRGSVDPDVQGADAIRFGLLSMAAIPGQRWGYDETRIDLGRDLCLRLWQALEMGTQPSSQEQVDAVVAQATRALDTEALDDYLRVLEKAPLGVDTLPTVLRLFHPVMPFITEELWHRLPGTSGSILDAPWPV